MVMVGVFFVFRLAIRFLSENHIMIETLEKREVEIQRLRAENSGKRPTTRSFVTFDCSDVTGNCARSSESAVLRADLHTGPEGAENLPRNEA